MPTTINGTTGASLAALATAVPNGTIIPAMTQMGALPSMVRVNTSPGYGSTDTCIVRFTNIITLQGSDITYTDSATLGSTFTINTNGVYSITSNVTFASANAASGISLNSTQRSTSIYSITAADRLGINVAATTSGRLVTSTCLYLPAGSVIRSHADSGTIAGSTECQFTITRVA